MKKKIKYNLIVYILLVLITLLFSVFLICSNILPLKYLLLIIIVFAFFLGLIWMIFFFKRKKKSKKRNIIGYVLSGLLTVIMIMIFFYLNNTLNFFKGFDNNKYKEENYLVVVLKDSKYNAIEDLNNKNIGYVPSELNKIGDALTELSKSVKLEEIKYEQYDFMFKDLIDKKIESLLVEESYLNMLQENGDYIDQIKTIYTVTIKTQLEDNATSVDVTKNAFTIYISGIDTYGKIASVSRSDVNIVATINPTTKQVLLISIPRDYYVQLHGTTGYKDKLTHAGLYGIDTSITTIEDLLSVDINYYYRVNFSTLEKIVDAIGGVDVYSANTFNSSSASGGTYRFTKGYNHMNGNQALAFSRERHALSGGDRARGENQKAVIDGIIRRATSPSIITKYTTLLNSLKGTFQTNMAEDDILKLIKMQLNDMAKWNITSYSLDGSDASEYTYSYNHQKLYVMKPKTETVNEAANLIDQVIEGNKLDSSYSDSVTNVKTPGTYVESTPIPDSVCTENCDTEEIVPEVVEPEVEEPSEEIIEEVTEPHTDIKPVITLNGNNTIEFEKDAIPLDPGATAVDSSGEVVIVTSDFDEVVNTSLVGVYTVTYTATDILNNTSTLTRTVKVIDSTIVETNPEETSE